MILKEPTAIATDILNELRKSSNKITADEIRMMNLIEGAIRRDRETLSAAILFRLQSQLCDATGQSTGVDVSWSKSR